MRTLKMLLSFFLLARTALAEPTESVVHGLSKGSKFIGTIMGGALVTREDAMSGELLARGYTKDGTGEGTPYAADVEVAEPGTYLIRAVAYHPASGNTGLDRSTFTVR